MTTSSASPKTTWQKIWIAIRFIVFGIGGFWLLIFCWIALIEGLSPHGARLLSVYLALPLAAAGALMMLFGGGVWGRWAYLWVFLSTPIIVSILMLLSPFLPDLPTLEILDPKLMGALVFSLPMAVSYTFVRRYYRRRDATKMNSIHKPSAPPSLEAE